MATGRPQREEPQGPDPRKAAALRGNIERLAGANRERTDRAEAEAEQERRRIDFRKRMLSLAQALSRLTVTFHPQEFDRLSAAVGGSDFTARELYDYLLTKLPMHCTACAYYLKGLPPKGSCPECGVRYQTGVFEAHELAEVLAVQLELPREQVQSNVLVMARIRALAGVA